ncbi:MAG: von Willebrand factor type A domain-containing protein [Alphaproteobacteria bacterium]
MQKKGTGQADLVHPRAAGGEIYIAGKRDPSARNRLAHAPSAAEASDRTQYFRFGASSSFEGQKTAVPSGVSTTRREQLKLASPPQVLAGAHGDIEYTQEEEGNRDRFETAADYAVKQAAAEPVSTFSIDVDTASYAFMRRALRSCSSRA